MVLLQIFKTPFLPNHKNYGPNILKQCSTIHVCQMSHVPCHMSCVLYHLSHIMCHVSYITCHFFTIKLGTWNFDTIYTSPYVSHVLFRMSYVTCHVLIFFYILYIHFFIYNFSKSVTGGSVINRAYPVYILPFWQFFLFLCCLNIKNAFFKSIKRNISMTFHSSNYRSPPSQKNTPAGSPAVGVLQKLPGKFTSVFSPSAYANLLPLPYLKLC